MNKREATIVSAYTVWLLGDPAEMHSYIEELFHRRVYPREYHQETQAPPEPDFNATPPETVML